MNPFDGSNSLLASLCSALVGLVFLVTGALKTWRPQAFFHQVKAYGILPEHRFLEPVLLSFIAFECALGLLLVLNPVLPVLALTVLLLLGFACLTTWGALTNRVEDCGCYGDLILLRPWQSIALDILYVALIAAAFWLQPAQSAQGWGWPVAAAAILAAVAVYFLARRNSKRPSEISPLKVNRPWRASWLRNSPRDLRTGKHMIVFLGRECPYCKRWVPLLNVIEVQQDLPGVIAVMGLSDAEIQQFRSEYLIHFPIAHMQRTLLSLMTDVVPTAVMVEDGIIREKWVGEMPSSYLERIRGFFEAIQVDSPPKRKAFQG